VFIQDILFKHFFYQQNCSECPGNNVKCDGCEKGNLLTFHELANYDWICVEGTLQEPFCNLSEKQEVTVTFEYGSINWNEMDTIICYKKNLNVAFTQASCFTGFYVGKLSVDDARGCVIDSEALGFLVDLLDDLKVDGKIDASVQIMMINNCCS